MACEWQKQDRLETDFEAQRASMTSVFIFPQAEAEAEPEPESWIQGLWLDAPFMDALGSWSRGLGLFLGGRSVCTCM